MGITVAAFAQRAVELAGLNPPIPYVLGGRTRAGTDCSNLIRLLLRELGGRDIAANSNSMWSSHVVAGTRFFIHNPGTLLVPGALLWIDYNSPVNQTSAGTPGKMDHVGIYVGNVPGLVARNGKQGSVIHASQSAGFVSVSTLQNAWTHGAWLNKIDYSVAGRIALPFSMPSIPGATAQQPPPPAVLEVGYARTTTKLRLRRGPGTGYGVINEMPAGAVIMLLGAPADGWVKARWCGATRVHEGFCSIDYLEFGEAS